MNEKIRWAPKVRQEKLWRLYQTDGQGLLDEDLLIDVGYAILARCESIFQIAEGKVSCPRCGTIFFVREPYTDGGDISVTCPAKDCGWQVTAQEYNQSIRHRELHIGQAAPAFEAYVRDFPKARTPQERMLVIDTLIHAFHWDIKFQLPGRPVANNLIEGSLEQVVNLLDRLTFGNNTQAKEAWRRQIDIVMQRRKGKP